MAVGSTKSTLHELTRRVFLRVFYVIEHETPRAVAVLGDGLFFFGQLRFDQVLYVAAEGLGDLV